MQYVCGNCGAVFPTLPFEGRCPRCDNVVRPESDSHEPRERQPEPGPAKKQS